jgi:Mg2+ and Co2+ transporter CorA
MTTERSEELKKQLLEGKDLKKLKKDELLEFLEILGNENVELRKELSEKTELLGTVDVTTALADELKKELEKSKVHITSLTDACGILERRFTELHRNYRILCGAWIVLAIVFIISLFL